MRVLSTRQPHAEAIMRGVKPLEFRSRSTKVRGRVYVYAALGRYTPEEEAEMMAGYGIEDVACDGRIAPRRPRRHRRSLGLHGERGGLPLARPQTRAGEEAAEADEAPAAELV